MADNKTKIDQIHDLMPSHFNTRQNTNWKALIAAIGEVDQNTADLISEVRKQFFIKTASRPYLDRLAANNKISRPRLVGMDDTSFRDYIPVLSYKPKQVKLIIDQLLDIFFFKESTTAFMSSAKFSPFQLQDGWELEYLVDELNSERIVFNTEDFTDIANATADEVVAAMNRQSKHSYATSYYDSITKHFYIKLFSKTIGSKGSLRISGGRSNVAFHFNGFLETAGNGSNTQWTVTKVGDLVNFQHTAGTSPGLSNVQKGDIVIINLAGNIGSFPITDIFINNDSIQFTNLFATPGVYTQTDVNQVKFVRPDKITAYGNPKRAITWETVPGEFTVEMPTSPPVVKRSLQGSAHINGLFSNMTNRISNSSLTVSDASEFPNAGNFLIEEKEEVKVRWFTPTEDTQSSFQTDSRLQFGGQKYAYTSRTDATTTGDTTLGLNQITNLASVVGLVPGQDITMVGIPGYAKVLSIVGNTANISVNATATATGIAVSFLGNTLSGITPDLPAASNLNQFTLTSLTRTGNTVTGVTSSPHGYAVGEYVIVESSSGVVSFSTSGNTVNNNTVLNTVASTSGIGEGMIISGAGIPFGTKVVNVSGANVTMSEKATATGFGVGLSFAQDFNGAHQLLTASGSTFTFHLFGPNGTTTAPGTSRVERIGMANAGSKIIMTDAISSDISRIKGTYVWDLAAPFVLSSNKSSILDKIKAGTIVRLLNTAVNDMSSTGGFLIFDYGLNTQEGPVRYLYKPTSGTIAIDPSYVFQKNHEIGSAIVAIRSKGPHIMSTRATEYPPYVTDPSEARLILQDLIRSVKSAGIFVDFLVRYPEQIYATLDVYQSGIDPG